MVEAFLELVAWALVIVFCVGLLVSIGISVALYYYSTNRRYALLPVPLYFLLIILYYVYIVLTA